MRVSIDVTFDFPGIKEIFETEAKKLGLVLEYQPNKYCAADYEYFLEGEENNIITFLTAHGYDKDNYSIIG